MQTDIGGSSLAVVMGQVWRHRLAAALAAGVVFACAAAMVLSLTPRYTATAFITLPTAQVDDPRTDVGQGRVVQLDPALVPTEMSILSSDSLIIEVIDKLGLAKQPSFAKSVGWLGRLSHLLHVGASQSAESPAAADPLVNDAIKTYRDGFSAYNDGRSYVATVSFEGPDPRLDAAIANAHAEAYIASQSERRLATQQRAVDLLDLELARQKVVLASAQQRLAADSSNTGPALPQSVDRRTLLANAVSQSQVAIAQILARRDEAQAAISSGTVQGIEHLATDGRLRDRAMVPTAASFPHTGLFLAVAAVLAAMAGIAMALVLESFVIRLRHIEEYAAKNGIAVLGSVSFPDGQISKSSTSEWTFWEQIRRLRDTASTTVKPQVLLVSSTLPGEGKSMISSALAQTYAAAGRRTLLINADLRAADQHHDSPLREGLTDALRLGVPISEVVLHADKCLDLLPPGRVENGVDVLASDALAELFGSLRQRYDVVVVDSAPMAAVSDGIILAGIADYVMLLVHRKTPFKIASRTIAIFQAEGVRIDGIVATGISPSDTEPVTQRSRRLYARGLYPFAGRPKPFPILIADHHAASIDAVSAQQATE